jgi:hypothetical protein
MVDHHFWTGESWAVQRIHHDQAFFAAPPAPRDRG